MLSSGSENGVQEKSLKPAKLLEPGTNHDVE